MNPFAASTLADVLSLVAAGIILAAAWLLLPRPRWRRQASRTWVDVPPSEVGPALAGVLRSGGTASDHHLAALLIDLAVRGYLRFDEHRTPENKVGHRLVRGDRPADHLEPYEGEIIERALGTTGSIELSALRERGNTDAVRGLLEEEVRRRGWIRRRPTAQRAYALSLAAILAVVGAGLLLIAFTRGSAGGIPTMGLGWPGVVFLLVAVVAGRFGRRPARRLPPAPPTEHRVPVAYLPAPRAHGVVAWAIAVAADPRSRGGGAGDGGAYAQAQVQAWFLPFQGSGPPPDPWGGSPRSSVRTHLRL